MPVLTNSRHERFAQELAQGKTADEAYVIAGFKANAGNASRLKGNENISKRVVEIVTASAKKVGITVERVAQAFSDIAFAGDKERTVDRLTALDRLGKHLGMFKVHVEQHHIHDFSGVNDDDLLALRSLVVKLEAPVSSRH